MKRTTHLTPGEFELMEILWQLREASVKDVLDRVDQRRELAYTTVMTVLDKMRRKGQLHYRKKGKAFIYSPAIHRDQALAAALDHVVDTYFRGSRTEFLRFVNGDFNTSGPTTTESAPSDYSPEPKLEEFLL